MNYTISASLSDLPAVAQSVGEALKRSSLVVFRGEMGAGKTTLITELCRQLGVTDRTGSPTFSIINEYKTEGGGRICHFDFYRINQYWEAIDLGWFDYLESDAICLVEWPEKIETLLPASLITVKISQQSDGNRLFDITAPDA